MYELFEHTADLGLRVEAPDLDGLFVEAGRGLVAMIVDNPDAIRPRQEVSFELAGADREFLLFDWLNELLFRFETEHLLFAQFDVRIDAAGLTASARGEPLDRDRHHLSHEVKAITYHHLKVAEIATGWRAEVIVDI